MAKRVIAKKWHHLSNLGEGDFSGVPIFVDDDHPAESGSVITVRSSDRRVIGPAGDVIDLMEREVAKKWVIDFVESGRKRSSISAKEIHGILLVLGLNKSDFAKLVSVTKSTVTKYVLGTLKPTEPVGQLMVIYLAAELTKPGAIKKLLENEDILIHGTSLNVPAPKFAIGRAA